MRVLAAHRDVIVIISRVWQTTCTAVRSGEEGFVIDSPVYPDELETLPELLEQAGFPVSGLLATHGDWDHLLGRLAFPRASLGCAQSTAARLRAEPGAAQRALRRFDEDRYVQRRGALRLANVQELPVPGRLALGPKRELELHPASGHTADGMALLIPWAGVLVCGDYLSPVELPSVDSLDAYLETLARMRAVLERAETVVPGHGAPITSGEAARLLDEDERYLAALREHGLDAPLPPGRASSAQARIHAQNAQRLS